MRWSTRWLALGTGAAFTGGGLLATVRGGGLPALSVALLGWAALTALASGVVRGLRLGQAAAPRPPIAAASLGALGAGLVIGDPGDLPALALHEPDAASLQPHPMVPAGFTFDGRPQLVARKLCQ